MTPIPASHPRYTSLITREKIVEGVRLGITSPNGLIAHGRGEAFDYLLKEKTHLFAKAALQHAATLLLNAKHPVISVNGNTAVLVTHELILLSELLHAPLEVNLFHSSGERLRKIKKHLRAAGATNILLPNKKYILPFFASDRKYVNPQGIWRADVIFVPLEDGDRAEALIKNGKTVITVDLNPLSRTAQKATVSIVDNITRALPLLNEYIRKYKNKRKLPNTNNYSNVKILAQAVTRLKDSV